MKKIIVALVLIGLSYTTQAQSRRSTHELGAGFAMTIGGIGFTIGGFTTRPEKFYTSSGAWQIKPFHKQGARSSAIVCGISLTITGLITSIINAPKQR
jgi:UPF0716 family protein affecting phage T7 exclusion